MSNTARFVGEKFTLTGSVDWYTSRYNWMNGQLETPASVANGC